MLHVLYLCLVGQHDLRLVALAAFVCLLSCFTVTSLYASAMEADGARRMVWTSIMGLVFGCGVWATHFIAELAYSPGIPIVYDMGPTFLSAVFAIVIAAIGSGVGTTSKGRVLGGVILAIAVVTMHYTGIAAMRAPAIFHWNIPMVAASISIAVGTAAFVFPILAQGSGVLSRFVATAALILTVCGLHFTAMAALTLEFDPAALVPDAGTPPELLGIPVAGVTAVMVGIALASTVVDRQFAKRTAAQARLLDLALNTMRHGLVMVDKDQKVVLLNRAYLDMYRLDSCRAKPGCTVRDLLKLRADVGTVARDIDDDVSDLGSNARVDGTFRGPDGRSIHVVNRELDDGGWLSTHEDVTVRVSAEEERDRSRQFLDQIIENVPFTIFAKDAGSGRYLLVNRAAERLWGRNRSLILGKTAVDILSADAAAAIAASDGKVLDSDEPVVITEEELLTPNNGLRKLTARRIKISDVSGDPKYLLAVVEDVTERKALEQQLIHARKMEAIGNLTGGMAHDFNNLLGVIIGNLDLVCLPKDDEDNAVLVREAMDAAQHGAELTRSLLAYARRQPLHPDRIIPNDLVAGMVRLLSRTLGEDIRIGLDLTDDLWPIEVDPAQLEACIINLATNARDAMPSGGDLVIATRNARADDTYLVAHPDVAPGDYAVIEVTDSGCGMPPEVMKQVFEPFFTTKEVGKGTGLGLSMVFGFINQSGGFVTVYSERDVGTTFRLHLPRCAAVGDTNRIDAVEAIHEIHSETILVVEDNEALRRVVVRQLAALGYRVLETQSATEAIDMIERTRVDLVFSDVVMPGEMDGLGLIRHVIMCRPDVAVLLTSGFPEKKFEDRFKHMPASVRLLSKPYIKEQLAVALRDALSQKQLALVET